MPVAAASLLRRTRDLIVRGTSTAAAPANMLGFLFITLLAIRCCRVCEGGGLCHDEERRALLEFRESINYPNGTALADWRDLAAGGDDDDCCLWSGITCNVRTGRVVDITLIEARTVEDAWYPNFTSSLPQLRELQGLNLAWNKIGGTFPDGLCNLTRLKKLRLPANSLGGPIPQCLCRMRSLTKLGLSLNHFNGSIPSCLANLYNLEQLDLDVNDFEGSIPPSIFSNLTKLTTVQIGSDGLHGNFPFSALANLSSLVKVVFRSNYGLEIETESPSSWVPSFQLTSLLIIKCVLNKRDGTGRFPTGFISTQTTSLESLSLADASITGAPPLWVLCNSSLITYLDLSGNMLHGEFNLPCGRNASTSVDTIELSRNRIRGSLPSDVGSSLSGLRVLRMAGNELEGSIPPSLGRAPLIVLDLSDNRLTGELPRTLTTNQTTLQYLNLSYNQLGGEMLPGDSHMPSLQFLYLQHNRFRGSIPPKTFNLTLLRALHLGHNDLTCSLSQCLPRFPSMVALSLRRNRFQGPLPSHLCLMQQLQLLDLSGNNLSGEIPACLNNISLWRSSDVQEDTAWWSPLGINYIFTNEIIQFTSKNSLNPYQEGPLALMTGLDVSSNQIDGAIPWEIGELRGLKSLNLSYNRLRGTLPESISEMESLESLDLSHNRLTGAIPHAVVQLNFLSAFSVAFNNLSGEIPHGSQFSTFAEISYQGNPGLCGAPLGRSCSSRSPAVDEKLEAGEEGGSLLDNTVLFYSWLVLSFGLGFWGFIATSVFWRRLRNKYYGAVDRFYNGHLKRS